MIGEQATGRETPTSSVRPEPFGSAQGRLRAAEGGAESKGGALTLDLARRAQALAVRVKRMLRALSR